MTRKKTWEIILEVLFWVAIAIVFLTENRIFETIAGVYALVMIVFFVVKLKREKAKRTLEKRSDSFLKIIKEFSEKLPAFPDGRIDYTNSKKAPVLNCFVEHNGKVLLLKRSNKVLVYKGLWNSVGGYLDEPCSLEQKIEEELREELGIEKSNIKEIKIAKHYELPDESVDRTWIIFPALAKLENKPKIKLDWEHTAYEWIDPREISNYQTVTGLEKILARVL